MKKTVSSLLLLAAVAAGAQAPAAPSVRAAPLQPPSAPAQPPAEPPARIPPAAPAAEKPVVLKERPVRLPPFFWYERDVEEGSRLVMAAMLYWDVKAPESSHRLLLPLYYHWREGDRSFLVSLPLILSYGQPGDRWLLAVNFYRKIDPDKTQTLFFPLYWQRVRREGGRVTSALPFVLYDYRSRDRSKIDTVLPVGFLRRRGDMSLGLVGPYFWQTDPESRFRVLFPVYWRARSPELRYNVLIPFYHVWTADSVLVSTGGATPGRDRAGLFPLAGAGWGRDFRSSYVFPLYYALRDQDRSGILTIPYSSFRRGDGRKGHALLYFYNHDPDLKLDGLFPLFFRKSSADGFESSTQVLNFLYSRQNEDSFHTLFPLYGAWRSPESSQFLSWGFWRRRDEEGSAGWALLYFWKESASGDENRIFLPLYWHLKRAPSWQVDVFFPLYYRYQDGDTVVTAIPPVIVRRSPGRRSVSLFFLYWHDTDGTKSVTTLAPLFLSRGNAHSKNFYSPIFWTRRSKLSREGIFLPAYWYRSAEARRTLIVPIYWDVRTKSMDLWIIPPVYSWRRGQVTEVGLFPLWGRRTAKVEKDGKVTKEPRGGYLFPFYWADTDGKGNGTWIIPPIVGFVNRSGNGTENETFSMQYLLLGSVRKRKDELEHGFFPLYQYVRRGDYVNWWAPRGLALSAYERRGTAKRGIAINWLWWRDLGYDRDLVLPLFYRARAYEVISSTGEISQRGEKIGGATVFFPIWWSGSDRDRSYLYVPPLYAQDFDARRRWRMVLPLWVSYSHVEGRDFRMFFPLYWRYASGELAPSTHGEDRPLQRKQVLVLAFLYRVDTWREGKRTRTLGLAPLFSHTYTGPNDRYYELLGGLFGRDIQEGRRRFRFLWLIYTSPKPLKTK